MNELVNPGFSLIALRSGDKQEIARLVDAYSNQIYHLGLKMLGNPQDAEDILQNTFLKMLQNIKGFEGRSSISTWLYRIAANEALMLIRKKKPEVDLKDQSNESGDDNPPEPENLIDWCCLPEQELLTAEARDHLDLNIANLPEKLRIVFILRDIDGLSIESTAEALNISETAVKTRLLRARLHLREGLSNYYGERFLGRMDYHAAK